MNEASTGRLVEQLERYRQLIQHDFNAATIEQVAEARVTLRNRSLEGATALTSSATNLFLRGLHHNTIDALVAEFNAGVPASFDWIVRQQLDEKRDWMLVWTRRNT